MNAFSEQVRKGIANARIHPAQIRAAEAAHPGGFGQAEDFTCTTSIHRRILAIVVNVIVLAELTIAMFVASRTPDALTPVFFKTFFAMLVPTLVAAFMARRYLCSKEKG